MRYLNRAAAGLPDEIWQKIDQSVVSGARDILTARRYLDLEGPYGVGLTAVEIGADDFCRPPREGEAGAVISRAISVPMLRREFNLSVRRVEGYSTMGQPLDLVAAQDAGEAIARREEEFIYYGQSDFHLEGLMTAKDRNQAQHGDWSRVEEALGDVLNAVNLLDAAGYYGPYALALSPVLYNNLFRRYEGTDMLQLEHLRRLCEAGVYKASIDAAVLVDVRVGTLILGQDLMTGFSANDGILYRMFASESIVLRIQDPKAICTLSPKPA